MLIPDRYTWGKRLLGIMALGEWLVGLSAAQGFLTDFLGETDVGAVHSGRIVRSRNSLSIGASRHKQYRTDKELRFHMVKKWPSDVQLIQVIA